jgi:hypothetical protein
LRGAGAETTPIDPECNDRCVDALFKM